MHPRLAYDNNRTLSCTHNFAPLNARSQAEISAMLSHLSVGNQTRLIEAMQTIEQLLVAQPENKASYLLRSHPSGRT